MMEIPPVAGRLLPICCLLVAGPLLAQENHAPTREAQERIGDTGWDPFRVYLYGAETLDAQRGTWDVATGREVFELAHVILALTPFADRTVRDDAYARDVEAWFGSFRDHPLIEELSQVEPDNYAWYNSFRLNSYLYCFDGEWVFLRSCEPLSHIYGRVANQFVQHAELIVDFVWDTDYRTFFAEHEAYYEQLEGDFRARVPLEEMWAWLEERYPTRVDRYEIVFPAAGYGVHHTNAVDYGDFLVGYLFLEHVSHLPEDEIYRAHRMVFTELDHRYDSPISKSDEYEYKELLNGKDLFGAELWVDRERLGRSYAWGSQVFAEYMTWAMFELWAAEHYDQATLAKVHEDVTTIMVDQRGFLRYEDFAAELKRLYAAREGMSMLPLYDDLIEWGRRYVAESRSNVE